MTISDFENELQAICPGNRLTSATIIDSYLDQEVPQTPLPFFICVQANGPWNGPRSNLY